jgi:ABC-type branched-subunit amino acid transport system substrate-binding protein
MKYFQSLDNANNKKFVAAFKAKYGAKSVIGDVTQAAYLGPWLWKAAVERPAASTSTRWWRLARHRTQDRARGLREGRRTTTCGARRASGWRSLTASSRWWRSRRS